MHSKLRRQRIKQLIGLGTLGAGGLMGMVQRTLAQGNKPVGSGIYSLKGEVLINGKMAFLGQLIPSGATVTTRSGAEVTFVIEQDAFLLRENSVVRFGTEAAKDFSDY